MSELEKEEFTRRINGMSEEEKTLAVSLMPSEILVSELENRFSEQEKQANKLIWSIRAVSTKKVFPAQFELKEQAEDFKKRRPNPDHWEVVKQEIIYSDWAVE